MFDKAINPKRREKATGDYLEHLKNNGTENNYLAQVLGWSLTWQKWMTELHGSGWWGCIPESLFQFDKWLEDNHYSIVDRCAIYWFLREGFRWAKQKGLITEDPFELFDSSVLGQMIWQEFVRSKLSEGLDPKTLEDYERIIKSFRDWTIDTQGKDYIVDKSTCEAYLAHLTTAPARHQAPSLRKLGKPISPYRRRNVWVALKSLYGWMYDNKICPNNPMADVIAPKLPDYDVEVYEKWELKGILDAIDKRPRKQHNRRDYAMFSAYIDTGARAAELLRITVKDVDFTKKTIRILFGKRKKQREVPFGDRTGVALRKHIRHEKLKEHDLIFDIKEGRALQIAKQLCKIAGIKKRPRPLHCIRHTWATNLLTGDAEKGIPPVGIDVLKTLGGWTNYTMPDWYTKSTAKRRAINQYHHTNQSLSDQL